MERSRFIAALRDEAKAVGLPFKVDLRRGKGSHALVTVGAAYTFVPDRDIDPKTAKKIRKALGLPE